MRQLDKIAWIDFEATGKDPNDARITQVAVFLTDMNFNVISDVISTLVNPTVPIPPSSTLVHGITDEMVVKAPLFAEIAAGLYGFIKDAHFGGYNVKYDVKLLLAELERVGITLDIEGCWLIDPLVTLRKKEPRDQSTVYTYYTGKVLDDAHNAVADITATLEIARAQIAKYEDVNSAEDMWRLSEPENQCDLSGKIKMEDGVPVFNFGKHYGRPISEEKGYLQWMMTADMPGETKKWIEKYLAKEGGQNV